MLHVLRAQMGRACGEARWNDLAAQSVGSGRLLLAHLEGLLAVLGQQLVRRPVRQRRAAVKRAFYALGQKARTWAWA